MNKTIRKGFISLLLSIILISTVLIPSSSVFASDISIYISPASQTVDPGDSFTVEVYISSDTINRCAQADVHFDPALVQVDSVTEGTYYSDWASANGGGTQWQAPTIDNTNGIINDAAVVVTGAAGDGATGTGTIMVISMTALTDVNGVSTIGLAETLVGDVNIDGLTHTTTDGTVTVGQPEGPDLVVSEIEIEWVDESAGIYNVIYTITNQGTADADASTTEVDIDGTAYTYACSALAAGASEQNTVGEFTIEDEDDVITVTADSVGVVTEGNEGNNTKQYTLAPSATVIEGNPAGTIILSVPESILEWELVIGDNTESGTMNVKCNTEWQVTVSDDDTTTGGHMTEWDGAAYGDEYLDEELTVESVGHTVGLENSGIIASGDSSGQDGNDGEDVDLTFGQTIEFDDPVLSDGSVYRIVITFTGEMTF